MPSEPFRRLNERHPPGTTDRALLERLPDPHLTRSSPAFSLYAHHDGLQPTQHQGGLAPAPARPTPEGQQSSISRTAPPIEGRLLHDSSLSVRDRHFQGFSDLSLRLDQAEFAHLVTRFVRRFLTPPAVGRARHAATPSADAGRRWKRAAVEATRLPHSPPGSPDVQASLPKHVGTLATGAGGAASGRRASASLFGRIAIVRRALSSAIVRSPLGIAHCSTARTLEAIVATSASRQGPWTDLSEAGAGASRLIARAGAISRSRPGGHCTAPSAWLVLSMRPRDLGVHSSGAEHNQRPQREAPH